MSSPLKPMYADSTPARGVVFVHSCPRALSPHVEWALTQVLEVDISLEWTGQPVVPGSVRAEVMAISSRHRGCAGQFTGRICTAAI